MKGILKTEAGTVEYRIASKGIVLFEPQKRMFFETMIIHTGWKLRLENGSKLGIVWGVRWIRPFVLPSREAAAHRYLEQLIQTTWVRYLDKHPSVMKIFRDGVRNSTLKEKLASLQTEFSKLQGTMAAMSITIDELTKAINEPYE